MFGNVLGGVLPSLLLFFPFLFTSVIKMHYPKALNAIQHFIFVWGLINYKTGSVTASAFIALAPSTEKPILNPLTLDHLKTPQST